MVPDHKNKDTLHGVAISINGYGVCVIGEAGIGKSELGLALIDRGNSSLIADDVVVCSLYNNKIYVGADPNNYGFMHIRGIGFLNIAQLYQKSSITTKVELRLIIELINIPDTIIDDEPHIVTTILGVNMRKICLYVGNNNRQLPLLVETLVKNYILCDNGYDAHQIFIEQQANLINKQHADKY